MDIAKIGEKYSSPSPTEEIVSRLNQALKAVAEPLIKPERLRQDLLVTVLLIVMKENGFVQLKDVDKNAITIEDYILSRKDEDVSKYQTVFVLKPFPNTPMKMILSPLKDAILINATIPRMHKETYSLCLKLGRYVVNSELGIPASLSNLTELFVLFKDKVVTPIKSGILNCNSYPGGTLSGLPEDVLLLIILRLPLRDVLSLCKSCKRLYEVVKEDRVWYNLYVRDFVERKHEGDWYNMYKEAYKMKFNRVLRNSFEFAVLPNHSRNVDSRWEVIL